MRNKKLHITIIVIFLAIIAVCLYYICIENTIDSSIKLGLDLKGGTQIILKPTKGGQKEVTSEDIDDSIRIIRERIDRLGLSEPLVTKDLSKNIVVQLPGVKDREKAIDIIGKTAQLEFRLVTGTFISIKNQNWDTIKFDYGKGELIIDPDSEEVILIDDINALVNGEPINIIARLIEDPETGELLLVEPDEESNEEDSSGADTGINIDPEKVIGKIIYNSKTRELFLVSGETGEEIGEILVDSRSEAATIVEPLGPDPLTGDKLAQAIAGYDSYGKIRVALSFKEEGISKFDEITSENIGRNLAIVLDEEIRSAPYIRVPISDGEAEITGISSIEEAKDIELVLQTGAFPITLLKQDISYVGPTLGMDSLNKGLYAGIAGLILIVVFMIAYYRGLGLVSTLSLIVYVMTFWGILAGIGAALTLPGIAGIILTIGMAVDANVIIFERIKEEARKGKSPRVAVGDGFRNALRTIIDSNVTTLITAAALYRFGTGPIRGFAVTLGLGVVISMFTSLLFTRSILFLMSGISRIATSGFSGVRGKGSSI